MNKLPQPQQNRGLQKHSSFFVSLNLITAYNEDKNSIQMLDLKVTLIALKRRDQSGEFVDK